MQNIQLRKQQSLVNFMVTLTSTLLKMLFVKLLLSNTSGPVSFYKSIVWLIQYWLCYWEILGAMASPLHALLELLMQGRGQDSDKRQVLVLNYLATSIGTNNLYSYSSYRVLFVVLSVHIQ